MLTVIVLGVLSSVWTAWILWLAPIDGLTADRDALAARDFTVLWTAGRLAGEHVFDILSDPAQLTVYIRGLFGPGMPHQIWPYPPPILLLARPLAALPFVPGFLVYTVLSVVVLMVALRASGLSNQLTAVIFLSPAVAASALAGQNGALIAALMIGGLLSSTRYPALAGMLFAGLLIKPQFGLLIPVCLIASRQVRTSIYGCASAICFALVSLYVFGDKPWVDFFTLNRATVTTFAGSPWQAEPAQSIFCSVFMAARSLGASLAVANALQAVVALGCVGAAWRLWSHPGVPMGVRAAATMALAMLASPWVHTYDLPALAISIALIHDRYRGWKRGLLGLAWLWPGLSGILVQPPLVSMLSIASVAWLAGSAAPPGVWLVFWPSFSRPQLRLWPRRPTPPATSPP